MANSKVQLADGTVLLDISQDTVSAEKLLDGFTAHTSAGEQVTGTLFRIGDTWSTVRNVRPESILGFGTWKKIRESPFTWGEAKKWRLGELKQDTWNWDHFGKVIYVWIRIS